MREIKFRGKHKNPYGDEWDLGYLDKIEKIGNKWDNPKLLEEGK